MTFLVLNAVLVGVASLLISLKFGAKTIYAIGFISVAMAVMQQAVPGNVLGLADDKLLSAILGGALAGARHQHLLHSGRQHRRNRHHRADHQQVQDRKLRQGTGAVRLDYHRLLAVHFQKHYLGYLRLRNGRRGSATRSTR